MTLINMISVSLGGLALFLMAVIGAADVVGAQFGHPVIGAYELIETLMVIAIFMAVAAGQQNNMHINVELIRSRFGLRTRACLVLFSLLCSGFFFLLIGYFGWIGFTRSFSSGEIRQGQLGFPVWPARFALAVGAFLMVGQCLAQFVELLRALLAGRAHSVLRRHESHPETTLTDI